LQFTKPCRSALAGPHLLGRSCGEGSQLSGRLGENRFSAAAVFDLVQDYGCDGVLFLVR